MAGWLPLPWLWAALALPWGAWGVPQSHIRLLNACSDCPPLQLFEGHAKVIRSQPYSQISEYVTLPVGPAHITVRVRNSTTLLRQEPVHLPPNPMTYVVFGTYAALRTNWYSDSWEYAPDQAALRFLHLSEGTAAVDIKLAGVGTSIQWEHVPYASAGDFQTVAISTAPLRFSVTNASGVAVAGALVPTLTAEQSYTLALLGPSAQVITRLFGGYNPLAGPPKPSGAAVPEPGDPPLEHWRRVGTVALAVLSAALCCFHCLAQRGLLHSCY
eukprot:EG_transcript_23625